MAARGNGEACSKKDSSEMSDEKKPKPLTELIAMGRIDRLLAKLSEAERARVVRWVCDKHKADTPEALFREEARP